MRDLLIKQCADCLIWKSESFYSKCKTNSQGLAHWCKECAKARDRERYANDTNYRAKRLAKKRRWRAENLEHARSESRRWMMKNSARAQMHHVARKAAKLQATPAWADKAKIQEFYEAADFLGMVTGEWHHVDHIVPLRGKTVCGLHWEGNLQVLTATENLSKNNLVWPDMPQ